MPAQQDNTTSEQRPSLKGSRLGGHSGTTWVTDLDPDRKELSQGHIQNESVVTGVQAAMGELWDPATEDPLWR